MMAGLDEVVSLGEGSRVAAQAKRGKTRETPSSSAGGKSRKVFHGRRRSCFFCKEKIAAVDYKNIAQLRRFISERGKIKGRGNTGTCRKHQTQVAVAIKRAREIALLPYMSESEPSTTGSRPRSK
jgi:small subunit ribosomal protein S18